MLSSLVGARELQIGVSMFLSNQVAWWQVYPLGALSAPIHERDFSTGVQHRLVKLTSWFEYVAGLGCTGILLAPIFESAAHGYDTLDHFNIDSRLGTNEDFDELVAAAKRHNLAIILDGVFNHVGRNHPLVTETLASQDFGADCPIKIDWVDGNPQCHFWEGNTDLVELNHQSPKVFDLVVKAMKFWLAKGAAGWRLDVAYAIPDDFLSAVIDEVRKEFPDVFVLGEVIHGDYCDITKAKRLDSVTQYELWKAIWSSIKDHNMWELAWAITRHNELAVRAGKELGFNNPLAWQTFIGNHDVNRIASVVSDAGAALAAIFLFTLPGLPSIYYGDEQGFRGVKGEGIYTDYQLRPPLPDSPDQLAGFGNWLRQLYQQLIGLRRENLWLTNSFVEVVDKTDTTITYRCFASQNTSTDASQPREFLVSVELAGRPKAQISVDGQLVFDWVSDFELMEKPN